MARTHAALLRGINVGGNKKVDMAGLRALLEELGYTDVKTLLNSGNAVFGATSEPDRSAIEDAIRARYGFPVAVILRDAAALQQVVAADPFAGTATDPSRYFVTFLDPPLATTTLPIDPASYEPELLHVTATELYSWLPTGIGDSKLMKAIDKLKLTSDATTRNWNTLLKIHALL